MKIQMYKFSNYAELNRAHYNDSGADCFCCKKVTIPAHGVVAVPTGIGLNLPDGYDCVIHCKSGLSKKGIWAANSPVDAGYKPTLPPDPITGLYPDEAGGQIHAILYNTTDTDYTFYTGDKIGQFVIRPVVYAEFVNNLGGERGGAGFGSTGK